MYCCCDSWHQDLRITWHQSCSISQRFTALLRISGRWCDFVLDSNPFGGLLSFGSLLQGCVLYELCTGRQPFTHTNFSELARLVCDSALQWYNDCGLTNSRSKIQTETLHLPVQGCSMPASFWDLLERLLAKDPYRRITWYAETEQDASCLWSAHLFGFSTTMFRDELIDHPFWGDQPRLAKTPMPAQELFLVHR